MKTSQWLRDGDVLRVERVQITVDIDGEEARLRAEEWKAPQKTDPLVMAPKTFPSPESAGQAVAPIAFQPVRIGAQPRARRSVRPREIFLWTTIAVLIAAAWFVFTARSVRIETEPTEARVELEGSLLIVELAGRFLLRPGAYTVIIEQEGYRRLEAPIRVTDARDQRLRFTLEKRPGVLRITTVPEEGTVAFIDGEEIGATPLAELELAPGAYQIRVRAERYKDFVTDIEIGGAETVKTLTAELAPRWAAVTFTSEPGGATVRVDGKTVGESPVAADLLEGAHVYAGISDLLALDGTFIHPRAAERAKFCSAHNRPAPEAVTSAHADVEPTGAAAFRAFLRHRSTLVPFRRQPSLHLAARQPAGTGSAQILRSISPKSRRFRCPSASRSQ